MRFQDWDVLLFPRDGSVPIAEFRTSCYIHETVVGETPLLCTFVPSLPPGAPFHISIHRWSPATFSAQFEACTKGENFNDINQKVWGVVVLVNGQVVVRETVDQKTGWTQIFGNTGSKNDSIAFPVFDYSMSQAGDLDFKNDYGRIKVFITEGIQIFTAGRGAFRPVAPVATFSFTHAPLDVLERQNIAWPNQSMYEKVREKQAMRPPPRAPSFPWMPPHSGPVLGPAFGDDRPFNGGYNDHNGMMRPPSFRPSAPQLFPGHAAGSAFRGNAAFADRGDGGGYNGGYFHQNMMLPSSATSQSRHLRGNSLNPYPHYSLTADRSSMSDVSMHNASMTDFHNDAGMTQRPDVPRHVERPPHQINIRLPSDQLKQVVDALSPRSAARNGGISMSQVAPPMAAEQSYFPDLSHGHLQMPKMREDVKYPPRQYSTASSTDVSMTDGSQFGHVPYNPTMGFPSPRSNVGNHHAPGVHWPQGQNALSSTSNSPKAGKRRHGGTDAESTNSTDKSLHQSNTPPHDSIAFGAAAQKLE